jgi:hypothetical protein
MDMDIPFSILLQEISMIKPTFNPILDICTIKNIGGYITNLTNFQKWKLCPKLIDEIILMNNSLFLDYKINNQHITDLIKKASSLYKSPSYTLNKVSYYVSDSIKESLNMESPDDVSKYFEMKSKYNDSFNQIKLMYKDEWDCIETQYEQISETLLENFSELENDINFEITTEIIDSIGNEISKEVEILIKQTAILIKENNTLKSEIKVEFNKKMDQIYEKIISSKNFDQLIHDVLIDMYGVEKEIHRMSLSLEECSNLLNMI